MKTEILKKHFWVDWIVGIAFILYSLRTFLFNPTTHPGMQLAHYIAFSILAIYVIPLTFSYRFGAIIQIIFQLVILIGSSLMPTQLGWGHAVTAVMFLYSLARIQGRIGPELIRLRSKAEKL